MTNQELELKIKELIKIENYFDMVVAMKNFEKEYKESEFFKTTRQPLMDAVKNARIHYALQLNDLFDALQTKLNNLNIDNLNDLMNKFGDQLLGASEENQQILSELKEQINEIK